MVFSLVICLCISRLKPKIAFNVTKNLKLPCIDPIKKSPGTDKFVTTPLTVVTRNAEHCREAGLQVAVAKC